MSTAKNTKLSASLEDYLEVIFNLSGKSKVARSKDIAELLDVSRASVTGALRLLSKKGLANYKPYGYVTLTESGQTAAAEVARKHQILKSFFVGVLGIQQDTAQKAACKAEHALGPAIIQRLLSFIDFVNQSGKDGYDVLAEFERFCQRKSYRGPKQQKK
jgi:DtxR family Mn-dependent transcriptional regulator